jgi:hypothetical protein
VLATNGHMDNFSPVFDQNLPSSDVQLDLIDIENLSALETSVDASTWESVPIIGMQETAPAPGALPHRPGSTSDLASAPGSSAVGGGGIHPTILQRLQLLPHQILYRIQHQLHHQKLLQHDHTPDFKEV